MQVHHLSNFVEQVRSGYMQQVQQVQQFFSLREECRFSCDVASLYLLLTNAICCDGPYRQQLDLGLTVIELLVDIRNLSQHLKILSTTDLASALLGSTFNSLHMLARFPATVKALLFTQAMETQPDPSAGPDGVVSFDSPYSQELGSLINEVCAIAEDCLEACSRRHAIAGDLLQRARSCQQRETFFARGVTVNPELVARFEQGSQTSRLVGAGSYHEEEGGQEFAGLSESADVTGMFSTVAGLPEQVHFRPGQGDMAFHSDFNLYSESKVDHQHTDL